MPGQFQQPPHNIHTCPCLHKNNCLFFFFLAQTWAESCHALPLPPEMCPQISSPVCVASYISHSAGEIYELAEAANEVDGNKGILGRNHMPE